DRNISPHMDRSDRAPPTQHSIGPEEGTPRAPANNWDRLSLIPESRTSDLKCTPSGHSDTAHNPMVRSKPKSDQTDSPSSNCPIDTEPNRCRPEDASRSRNRSHTANHHNHRDRRCPECIQIHS